MLKTRLIMGFASAALMAPQVLFAATPQQTLDRAVRLSIEQPTPQATMFDMNVKGSFAPSRTLSKRDATASGARTTPGSFDIRVIFEGESFPRGNAMQADGQGRIRLVKLASTMDPVMNFTNLGTLEWKTIDKVFYMRIAEVSPVIREQLSGLGADMTQLEQAVGMWLKFDPDALASFLQDTLPLGTGTTAVTKTSVSDWQKFSRILPILQVVRVEKKVTVGTQTFTRIAVRLHPGFWTRLEKLMITSIEESLSDLKESSPKEYAKARALRVKDLRTTLQATRLEASKARIVVMINDRSGRIERIEGALQVKSPSYAYLYRGTKMVKIVQGQETANFQLVGTMRGIENKTIVEPTPHVTLETLIERLMNMGRPEPTSELSEETLSL